MYMVYWTVEGNATTVAYAEAFSSEDMNQALQFMESLRARQRAGEAVSFVTMCSENKNSVGPAGVAEAGADYGWKKRRL